MTLRFMKAIDIGRLQQSYARLGLKWVVTYYRRAYWFTPQVKDLNLKVAELLSISKRSGMRASSGRIIAYPNGLIRFYRELEEAYRGTQGDTSQPGTQPGNTTPGK